MEEQCPQIFKRKVIERNHQNSFIVKRIKFSQSHSKRTKYFGIAFYCLFFKFCIIAFLLDCDLLPLFMFQETTQNCENDLY